MGAISHCWVCMVTWLSCFRCVYEERPWHLFGLQELCPRVFLDCCSCLNFPGVAGTVLYSGSTKTDSPRQSQEGKVQNRDFYQIILSGRRLDPAPEEPTLPNHRGSPGERLSFFYMEPIQLLESYLDQKSQACPSTNNLKPHTRQQRRSLGTIRRRPHSHPTTKTAYPTSVVVKCPLIPPKKLLALCDQVDSRSTTRRLNPSDKQVCTVGVQKCY